MPDTPSIGPSSKFLEMTLLNNQDENKYQNWLDFYKPKDIDPTTREPYDDVNYDYRGYWQANQPPPGVMGYGPLQFDNMHGVDTFKQHGHPTFSQESQYSRGPYDGGMWVGDNYLPQLPLAVSHKRR